MPDVARVLIPGLVGAVNPANLTAAQQCQEAATATAADRAAVEEDAAQVASDKAAAAASAGAAAGSATAAETAAGLIIAAPITVAGTSRTIGPDDYSRTLRFTSGTAVSVTLPANAPAGTWVHVVQAGAGALTFVAASGATVEGDALGRVTTAGQRSTATAWVDSNAGGSAAVWFLAGFLGS
ncbi:hypothetical protein J5J86_13905 [Aquabacter sp. L1I39]|uniref:hypothetical protein n=1 Tax=Aquabacter sp. L1I39 TaxID=2820278 RepID=UPI001ADA240C|nr:hypothetical protein [Aquabacter sp. L1I39]QTL01900.1 hypothetical protein J5J86_13905 [Aquabacter sp. L1I39]